MEGRKLQLSNLPKPILLHILSKLPDHKEVVRSSVLSTQWRFLWRYVPLSLDFFHFGGTKKRNADFVTSTTRELYYWRPSCQNIRAIKFRLPPKYEEHFAKDVDLWVHFATQVASVESLTLDVEGYEFPQFAYKNTSLRNLVLSSCQLNPSGSVNWTSLVSLTVWGLNFTDGVIEKVLCGCPNLESLKIDICLGFHRLEISSLKLRELSVTTFSWDNAIWLEIFAPCLQNLQLSEYFREIHLKNVDSLVTVVLDLHFHYKVRLEDELIKLKELLHSFTHVENLELGAWCIECLSILEVKGLELPPSAWKFLKLNTALERLDFPGICSSLQSSSDLETLVIDWHKYEPRYELQKYTNEDEQSRMFKTHNLKCSLLHLKTIKIINFVGPLSKNKCILPLAKFLLKNAKVLEKFIIIARSNGIVYRDYAKIEEKLLTYSRSTTSASVVFAYR